MTLFAFGCGVLLVIYWLAEKRSVGECRHPLSAVRLRRWAKRTFGGDHISSERGWRDRNSSPHLVRLWAQREGHYVATEGPITNRLVHRPNAKQISARFRFDKDALPIFEIDAFAGAGVYGPVIHECL